MLKEALEEVVGGGTVQCLNPWSPQGIRQYDVNGISPALQAGENGGQNRSGICYSPAAFMGGQGAKAGSIAYADDGSTPTIKSAPSGSNTVPDVVYPINTMVGTRGGADDGRTTFGVGNANDPQFTISAAHEHAVCYKQTGFAEYKEGVGTLKASGGDVGGVLKASSSRIYDARGNGDGKTIPTLTGDHENRITDYTALCVERKVDE